MFGENTGAKKFRSLILPAVVLVMLGGFFILASEDARAIGDIFEFKQSEYTFSYSDSDMSQTVSLAPASNDAVISSWKSTNTNVATIGGRYKKYTLISICGCGDTVIEAKDINGNKASCTVHVEPVKVFAFEETEVNLKVDDSYYILNLTNDYADDYDDISDISWSSSDESVVSLDDPDTTSAGLDINGEGEAIVTAEDTFGNEASCNIIVRDDSLKLDTDSITIDYTYDPSEEFDVSEYYCYYRNYVVGNIGQATWVQPVSGKITRVYSDDPDIVSVTKIPWEYNGAWAIIPTGKGTGSLVCVGEDGDEQTLTVTVPAAYMNSYMKYHASCYAPYGGQVRIKAPATSDVSIAYGGKTYKKTDVSGTTYFDVPVKKLGTAVTCSINYGNYIYKINGKVTASASSIKTGTIYRSTKKTRIRLTNVHKGDMVWVKVGKKTIKKKINKNAASYSCTVKLPKKKTAGKKVKITLKNKYKQSMKTTSKKIWYASKVKKGMTKKQCKLVPAFGSPDRWYRYGRFESWYYDNSYYGYARLTFKNGRLWSWWY